MERQPVNLVALKRKIRELKRLEIAVRFGGAEKPGARLVWDDYFDLRDTPTGRAKYSLRALASLNRGAYQAAIDDFFARVYFEHYRENGFASIGVYDPAMLGQLGLPFDAGEDDVKRRFRELAKRYHPDQGGDAEQFIELMRTYRALIGK